MLRSARFHAFTRFSSASSRSLRRVAGSLLFPPPAARAGRSPRAVGGAHDADSPSAIATMVAAREERRLQHAARAGARPRRRLLPAAGSSRARRRSRRSRRSIRWRRRIAEAHEAGLQVHAWINVNLICERRRSAGRARTRHLPPSRMADGAARSLAEELSRRGSAQPGYVGRLAR